MARMQTPSVYVLAAVALVIGAALQTTASASNQPWPSIASTRAIYEWKNPEKAGVDTPFVSYIRSPSGTPLYKLECHDGDYDDDSELDFSGVFQCALFALQGPPSAFADLLAANTKDEQSSDWWNRGRVLADQLQESCLEFPEYSTSRHFRLRGMKITLGITNITWSLSISRTIAPAKFTMTFEAEPDAKARAPEAELPGGPVPPKSCYP